MSKPLLLWVFMFFNILTSGITSNADTGDSRTSKPQKEPKRNQFWTSILLISFYFVFLFWICFLFLVSKSYPNWTFWSQTISSGTCSIVRYDHGIKQNRHSENIISRTAWCPTNKCFTVDKAKLSSSKDHKAATKPSEKCKLLNQTSILIHGSSQLSHLRIASSYLFLLNTLDLNVELILTFFFSINLVPKT